MNSNDFALQGSLEANYLNIQLGEEDRLDKIAVKVIQKDCPAFLIPFRLTAMNDKVMLKYKLINTVALEYANMTLPRDMFVQMYLNLLTPFINGKDWFLDYHNLCIDGRYIFIDKRSNSVYFIYVPVETYHNSDQEILEFFKKVFTNIVITDDKDFQVQMFRFFSSGQITLAGLYQILSEAKSRGGSSGTSAYEPAPSPVISAPKPMAQPIPQPVVQPKPIIQPKQEPLSEVQQPAKETRPQTNYNLNENPEDEVMQALFGNPKKKPAKEKKPVQQPAAPVEKKKGGLFGSRKKDPVQAPEPTRIPTPAPAQVSGPAQVPLYSMNMTQSEDETEVHSEMPLNSQSPWLELLDYTQIGAMPRINLIFNKPYIIVGRESSDQAKPDVAFPNEFKRIGRQHLRIEKEGNDIYVIDLGSANHTMLNGQILVPNKRYQLQDGMELAFTVAKPLRYRIHI